MANGGRQSWLMVVGSHGYWWWALLYLDRGWAPGDEVGQLPLTDPLEALVHLGRYLLHTVRQICTHQDGYVHTVRQI